MILESLPLLTVPECKYLTSYQPWFYKKIFIYVFILVVLGISGSTWDLQSSLQHAGSLVTACGIQFPDQGLNLGPLHWGAKSQPLDHQGSPPCLPFKVSYVLWRQEILDLRAQPLSELSRIAADFLFLFSCPSLLKALLLGPNGLLRFLFGLAATAQHSLLA